MWANKKLTFRLMISGLPVIRPQVGPSTGPQPISVFVQNGGLPRPRLVETTAIALAYAVVRFLGLCFLETDRMISFGLPAAIRGNPA